MDLLLFLIMSYALGSVSFALLAGKLLRGIDIREFGSGNVGATNAGRVLGRKVGVGVFLLDVLKGFVPAFVFARACGSGEDLLVRPGLLFGVAAILGHSFPFYLRFRGGKGVATSAGVLIAVAPLATGLALATWVVVIAVTRIVSVASIVAAIVLPCALALMEWNDVRAGGSRDLVVVTALLALLVIFRHRANVRRLLQGVEPRIGSRGKTSTQEREGGNRVG
jgi:glycerol-3-phosphate acyltransferase PlsY